MDKGSISYQKFLAGDKSGLVEIIRDYKDGLILYINYFVNDIYAAEDLAEDTFVKLATKKPKDLQKASFKTWLYRIGRNIAIDYYRKQKKYIKEPIESLEKISSDEENIEMSYIKDEEKRMLHKTMLKLKEEYRQVLWLIYFEDLSCKDAAKIMKKTVHSVENLVYRARVKLKEELEKEGYSYERL